MQLPRFLRSPMLDLLLLALVASAPRASVTDVEATVTALGGRVELLADDARVHALAPHAPRTNRGPAHLEIGSGGAAEVTWPGQGSVRLGGPCVLEWGPDAAALVPAHVRQPVLIRFDELGGAEFELRAPGLAIELPSGWRLHPRRSALSLERASGGAFRARARAGEPCTLEAPRWSACSDRWGALSVGSTLVLAPVGSAMPVTGTVPLTPAWDEVFWPWGARTADGYGAEALSLTSITVHVGFDLEAEPDARVETVAHAAPAASTPVETPVAPAESTPAPPRECAQAFPTLEHPLGPEPTLPGVSAAEPRTADALADPAQMTAPSGPAPRLHRVGARRGLALCAMQVLDGWSIETSPFLEIVRQPDGRTTVALSKSSEHATWCFGHAVDVQLMPGSAVVLLPGGRLGAHLGPVRIHAAPPHGSGPRPDGPPPEANSPEAR